MPALQVREFPDDLYARLKESAAMNHRSIAQQTIACVEAQLDMEERQAAILMPEFGGIPLPANVREAMERARPVDPFDWLHDFEDEPEEVLEARRKKRQNIRKQARELMKGWDGPVPTAAEVAQMIREDRDSDHGRNPFEWLAPSLQAVAKERGLL